MVHSRTCLNLQSFVLGWFLQRILQWFSLLLFKFKHAVFRTIRFYRIVSNCSRPNSFACHVICWEYQKSKGCRGQFEKCGRNCIRSKLIKVPFAEAIGVSDKNQRIFKHLHCTSFRHAFILKQFILTTNQNVYVNLPFQFWMVTADLRHVKWTKLVCLLCDDLAFNRGWLILTDHYPKALENRE